MHVTVVILPRLKKYAEVARNGVLSRAWGDNHDGVSFMVVKVRWVDEGLGRGVARSGKARREERLRKWRGGEAVRKMIRREKEGARERERAAAGDVRMEEVDGLAAAATPVAIAAA